MFFRREKPRTLTFDDHVANLKQAGFTVQPLNDGRVAVIRGSCATTLQDGGDGALRVTKARLIIANQAAELVHGGFQQFWLTPDGKKVPATVADLRTLHDFQEDLKEALGLVSLYNEGLGSTSAAHLYDRVKDRDRGVPERPWERH